MIEAEVLFHPEGVANCCFCNKPIHYDSNESIVGMCPWCDNRIRLLRFTEEPPIWTTSRRVREIKERVRELLQAQTAANIVVIVVGHEDLK